MSSYEIKAMKKEDLRIIFMGTPEFAVPSLEILVKNNYKVVAVITAADKPKGRGRKLTGTPVKQFAVENNIPVLQPANLKYPNFLEELRQYKANLQVVVAFRMLPEVVWNMPALGTFNLHASYLPNYRGAAPINWAIINGEEKTGVTTFMIKHEIDTGSIIFREEERIHPDDTAGTLYTRLMNKGSELVLKTVQAIQEENYSLLPQHTENLDIKPAPKIDKETCKINWDQPAEKIRNFVRGLSPYPAAWTIINTKSGQKICKIFQVTLTYETKPQIEKGEFITDNKYFLHIKAADQLLAVDKLQLEGKKQMRIQEFLRGNNL